MKKGVARNWGTRRAPTKEVGRSGGENSVFCDHTHVVRFQSSHPNTRKTGGGGSKQIKDAARAARADERFGRSETRAKKRGRLNVNKASMMKGPSSEN